MQNKIYLLFRNVSTLKGIGLKTKQALANAGVERIIDLLLHLPKKIETKYLIENANCYDFKQAPEIAIKLTVISHSKGQNIKGKKTPYKIICKDENQNQVTLFFINYYTSDFFTKNYVLNKTIYVAGKLTLFNKSYTISHPYLIGSNFNGNKLIETIYPSVNGVSSKVIAKFINKALEILKDLEFSEWHNKDFIKQNNLQGFITSILAIHNAKTQEDIDPENSNFVKRLALDEMLSYNLNLINKTLKYKKSLGVSFNSKNKDLTTKLFNNLPFTLSSEQVKAIKMIFAHMEEKWQSNQLLQGDVGSGKTIVSFFCALKAIENGYQVALIAPTTVLAKQHYYNALDMLKKIGVRVAILTSQNTKKEKKEIIDKLEQHKIDIIIGTHSLLEEDIKTAKLGLVIIDEQHKFGVMQRHKIIKKGLKPDIISMSATPIPRTVALSLKNFINVVTINSKPKNKKETKTSALNIENIDKLFSKLHDKLKENSKVFWVCPLVEESEKLDLMPAEERYSILQEKLKEFKNDIYLIHGKMKEEQKEKTLTNFKSAKRGILVSTTVIEVGVDIPSSNIVVIEEANRFGLSQLHQLRGRVGRGNEQGYCILLYKSNIGKNARARIKALKEHSSGFNLAHIDFMLRGYGDIIGTKQTGLISFKIANLEHDMELFKATMEEAGVINANKAKLKQNQLNAIDILLNVFFYKLQTK